MCFVLINLLTTILIQIFVEWAHYPGTYALCCEKEQLNEKFTCRREKLP